MSQSQSNNNQGEPKFALFLFILACIILALAMTCTGCSGPMQAIDQATAWFNQDKGEYEVVKIQFNTYELGYGEHDHSLVTFKTHTPERGTELIEMRFTTKMGQWFSDQMVKNQTKRFRINDKGEWEAIPNP